MASAEPLSCPEVQQRTVKESSRWGTFTAAGDLAVAYMSPCKRARRPCFHQHHRECLAHLHVWVSSQNFYFLPQTFCPDRLHTSRFYLRSC
jgi:hypothetical protein